jgi:RecJ-like exonuclease
MNHELAVRIASTEVRSLSWREAENVIRTYLTYLAVCPMCDGTGGAAEHPNCARCAGTGRDDRNVVWTCLGAEVHDVTDGCSCDGSLTCRPTVRVPQEGLVPTGAPLAELVDLGLSREL